MLSEAKHLSVRAWVRQNQYIDSSLRLFLFLIVGIQNDKKH